MIGWAILIYAVGIIAIDLCLLLHRTMITRSVLGPGRGYVLLIQVAVAAIFTWIGIAIAWRAIRDAAAARTSRIAGGGADGGASSTGALAFVLRLPGWTLFCYGLLTFLCPFLPGDGAIWYDPLVIAAAFAWIVWWRSVRAPARPDLRAPS